MYTNHSTPMALENQYKFCTALFTLMAQKPFERITVTELCREAGFERMTFYRHFDDKNDIIQYYLDQQMMLLIAKLPSQSTLYHNICALFEWAYSERRNLRLMMDNRMTTQLSIALRHSFFSVLAGNLAPDAVMPLPYSTYTYSDIYISNGVLGLFCGLLTAWRSCDFHEPPQDLARRMLVIMGLGSLLPENRK